MGSWEREERAAGRVCVCQRRWCARALKESCSQWLGGRGGGEGKEAAFAMEEEG
jgi:hypothetical protein